jgi:hypothetical protein
MPSTIKINKSIVFHFLHELVHIYCFKKRLLLPFFFLDHWFKLGHMLQCFRHVSVSMTSLHLVPLSWFLCLGLFWANQCENRRVISVIAWSSQLWSSLVLSRCLYYWIYNCILIKNDVKIEGRWRRYMTLWLNTFFLSWRILNILIQSKPFLLILFRTLIIVCSSSSIANLQWSMLFWFWILVLEPCQSQL